MQEPKYAGTHPDRIPFKDFDSDTLPWLDRPALEISRYVDALVPQPPQPGLLKAQLLQWMVQGYVVLPGVIQPALIDAYMADMAEMLANYRTFKLRVDCDIHPVRPIAEIEPQYIEDLKANRNSIHLRLNDFHNYSIAAKKMSLHPRVVEMIGHIFRDRPVVLQSLSFFTGSEQDMHADFAFVPACVPSQLVGSWIALEDIHIDSGPLKYIPGSQHCPKFDWGDGIFRTDKSTRTARQFHDYLCDVARGWGLSEQIFTPRKGDALIWHGALTHGGAPVKNRALTRKAYVSHYSKSSTHFHDFRAPGVRAARIEMNGGFLHKSPMDPESEDRLRHGAHV